MEHEIRSSEQCFAKRATFEAKKNEQQPHLVNPTLFLLHPLNIQQLTPDHTSQRIRNSFVDSASYLQEKQTVKQPCLLSFAKTNTARNHLSLVLDNNIQ